MKQKFTCICYAVSALSFLSFFAYPLLGQELQNENVYSGAGDMTVMKTLIDNEGNRIIAGNFSGTVDFDQGPNNFNLSALGSSDIFITKYDQSGNFVWANKYGHNAQDRILDAEINSDNSIVLWCNTSGSTAIDFNPSPNVTNSLTSGNILAKYAPDGSYVWAKRIAVGYYKGDVAISSNGDIAIVSVTTNTSDLDPSPTNTVHPDLPDGTFGVYLAIYNSQCDFLMAKSFYGTQGIVPTNVIFDHDNNLITAGYFWGTLDVDPGAAVVNKIAQNQDMYLIKLSSTGTLVWGNTYGGVTSDTSSGLACDSQNNIILCGRVFNTCDFDPSNVTNQYGGGCPTEGNAFVVKYNQSGAFVWIRHLHENPIGDFAKDVAVDVDDNIYISGYFYTSGPTDYVILGFVSNAFLHTVMRPVLMKDIFIAKFGPTGLYLCHRVIANDNNNFNTGELNIIVDNDYKIFVSGGFQGNIDFDKNATPGNYLATGTDGFVAIYTQNDPECYIPGNNGCTVTTACNYNPDAFVNIGCIYDCFGCTDPNAINYSSTATTDNGTCDYDNDHDDVSVGQGDCNDDNINIHPGALELCNNIDDNCNGQIDEGAGTWAYPDADNDGFGSQNGGGLYCVIPSNYVNNSLDCNDTNSNIKPNAIELCDGIDNNCNGIIDDNCSLVANDQYQNAVLLNVSNFNTCSPLSGTVNGATISEEANSVLTTGEDVWYKFTAVSPGVRIRVSTGLFNAFVELQNNSGSTIDTENAKSVKGNEILNYTGLTFGQTYYVAVRNVNNSQGVGSFTICVSKINASSLNSSVTSITSCNPILATNVGASSYTFVFTSNSTNQVYTKTQSSAYCIAGTIANLPFGDNFSVNIVANYNLPNSIGTMETFSVPALNQPTITTTHPDLFLYAAHQCPSLRLLNRPVRSNVSICSVNEYQWKFQLADESMPAFELSSGTTSSIILNPALGFANGQVYNVQIRCIYNNGFVSPWGTQTCMSIGTSQGMANIDDEEPTAIKSDNEEIQVQVINEENSGPDQKSPSVQNLELGNGIQFRAFPNPIENEQLQINISGVNNGKGTLVLIDLTGRVIFNNSILITGNYYQTSIDLSNLSSGIYSLNFINDINNVDIQIIKK